MKKSLKIIIIIGALSIFCISLVIGLFLGENELPNTKTTLFFPTKTQHEQDVTQGSIKPKPITATEIINAKAQSQKKETAIAAPAIQPDDQYWHLEQELATSEDNGLIKFVYSEDGQLFRELGNDPNSLAYKKPIKKYKYLGDRVISVTKFEYFDDYIREYTLDVHRDESGSITDHRETERKSYP